MSAATGAPQGLRRKLRRSAPWETTELSRAPRYTPRQRALACAWPSRVATAPLAPRLRVAQAVPRANSASEEVRASRFYPGLRDGIGPQARRPQPAPPRGSGAHRAPSPHRQCSVTRAPTASRRAIPSPRVRVRARAPRDPTVLPGVPPRRESRVSSARTALAVRCRRLYVPWQVCCTRQGTRARARARAC